MRRKKKEITDRAVILELLERCTVGRLGTIGLDGYPMVKPLNFVYIDSKIYFHTAQEGEKIADIKRNDRVCFEADLAIALLRAINQPCEAEYLYRSIIVRGRARLVEDREEKVFALKCLMDKYQPGNNFTVFPEEKLGLTGVVRIDIEEIRGKEDLGPDSVRPGVMKALKDNVSLPFDLERKEC